MTTDDAVQEETKAEERSNHNISSLPQEIVNIFDYLSQNTKIVFKSQQRDEPEMLLVEKVNLAKVIYQRNPQTFLMRFGNYMDEKQLDDFGRLSIAHSDEEMHAMVKDLQRKIKTRQQDVKNRRFAALQKLIQDGEYFSEQEMMKRAPDLYQELVGQYLSKEEKQQRDSYDVKNTTFSGILIHNMEQNEISEIMEQAVKQIDDSDIHEPNSFSEVESAHEDLTKEDEIEIPSSCRQQWGNFDNEQIACSSSTSSKVQNTKLLKKSKRRDDPMKDLITADERELLRQEFISQMHEQFLSGQDAEYDYATVDDNTQFDDLKILNQDREDKYFEDEDSDDDEEVVTTKSAKPDSNKMEEDESEDELDLYMSHLNKHHSLQK